MSLISFFVVVLVLVSNVLAGLVAHWEFDDGAGIAAIDSSNNSHDGTLQGDPQWVPGIIGSGALSFDGSDGLVDVDHDESLSITNELTITVWVKLNDLNTYYFLVCKQPSGTAGDNYPGNYEFRTEINSGALQFGHQETEGEQYTFYTSDSSIAVEQWHHVAVTVIKGDLVEFYIDGVAAGSSEQSTNFGVLNNEPVRIGGRKDGYSFFNGILDDIRLYDRALSAVQIKKLYNGNPPTFTIAEKPNPEDGALYADTWATISWGAGDFAVSHDVYIGDNFDDVNEATRDSDLFRGNQNLEYIIVGFAGYPYPDGLVPGTTYYWRIDEVNDSEPNSPWKGDVWSFSIPPKTAYFPKPMDGAELVTLDAKLSWTAGFGSKLHYIIFGEDFDEVSNTAMGRPYGTTTYSPGPLKLAKTYYWRIDESDGFNIYKGEVWSFTTIGAASNPNPANGAVDIKPSVILTWDAGSVAASYEVYFGTDMNAVRNATTASSEYKGPKALGEESYDPGKLEFNSSYYWRVDEVNDVNTDSPWAGNVWSFTTGDFFVIDDFEDYDTDENQIWYAWHDGLGYGVSGTDPYFAGNGTGAAVGDENTASYTEETIVHGGGKSMPVSYDNNKQGFAYYSEVEHTLTDQRDWTERGVDSLSIWFRGISDNSSELLYVAVSNSTGTPAVVVHDNPAATQTKKWTQWIIPLQTFTDQGINLTNVTSIAIGLGTKGNTTVPGGSGKMYIDDIRLYQPSSAP